VDQGRISSSSRVGSANVLASVLCPSQSSRVCAKQRDTDASAVFAHGCSLRFYPPSVQCREAPRSARPSSCFPRYQLEFDADCHFFLLLIAGS
jgi:hypothetical protein